MEEKNVEILLNIFSKSLENETFEHDKDKIIYACNSLKEVKQKVPTLEEIEKTKEIITDLEIKYEDFYEIANYFDPIYIKIKETIHKNMVDGIREENRKNREMK